MNRVFLVFFFIVFIFISFNHNKFVHTSEFDTNEFHFENYIVNFDSSANEFLAPSELKYNELNCEKIFNSKYSILILDFYRVFNAKIKQIYDYQVMKKNYLKANKARNKFRELKVNYNESLRCIYFTKINENKLYAKKMQDVENLSQLEYLSKEYFLKNNRVISSEVDEYFEKIFNQYYYKKEITFEDARFLELIYSFWSSLYNMKNNREIISDKKNKILFNNPHNNSFIQWLRLKAEGFLGKETFIVHVDSHTDLYGINRFNKNPMFFNSDVFLLTKLIHSISQTSTHKDFYKEVKNLRNTAKTKNDKRLLEYIEELYLNYGLVGVRREIVGILNIDNFSESKVEEINKIIKTDNSEEYIRNEIIKILRNEKHANQQVMNYIVNWVEDAELSEIARELYVNFYFLADVISKPLVPAVITGITDKIIMLKPAWTSRIKAMEFNDFRMGEVNLVTYETSYYLNEKNNEFITPAVNHFSAYAQKNYVNLASPFESFQRGTPMKHLMKFTHFTNWLNLETESEVLQNDNVINFINTNEYFNTSDMVLGIDVDAFVTNAKSMNSLVEPISYLRENNATTVPADEFARIKKRIETFVKLITSFKNKPKLITFADSTRILKAQLSKNTEKNDGGNFTPPALAFLLGYKLSKDLREVIDE